MLENFHLAAIVQRRRDEPSLLHIPLRGDLQNELAESWTGQLDSFLDGIEVVDFDPGYKPEGHERFRIADYELPEWLEGESSLTVMQQERLDKNLASVSSIRGTVGMVRDEQADDLMLFQNFTPSRVIRPGGPIMLLEGDTYVSNNRPGLTLDSSLSAVYRASSGDLLFRNFRVANTFLPLSDFYEAASEQAIMEILDHDSLAVENPEVLAIGANQWFRKRFTLLIDSGVLDRFTPQDLEGFSQGHEAAIELDEEGKIKFPSDKAEAKRLLQFLVEERFLGPITQTLYETNSKRPAT